MKYLDYDAAIGGASLGELFGRTAFPKEIELSVAEILTDIEENGNDAVVRYAEKFDNCQLSADDFLVSQEEIDAAESEVDEDIRKAVHLAFDNIMAFSQASLPKDWTFSPREGVTLGEKFTPLDRVACYVPGGTAPLVSTVLHTAAMAKAAGVKEICVATPVGPDKKVNPAILYTAKVCGVTEVYRLGGVYAIGAFAYGTETIRPAEKICGPGNAYVTAAKKLVYGHCSLDLVAGPSEVMVIADKTANPAFIAADLLSQAEHGSGREQAVLVTDTPVVAEKVEEELLRQKATLSRSECVEKVLAGGVFCINVKDMKEAAEVATIYAPEHLEIITENPEAVSQDVKAAGAIFLGPWTPEPVGDFVAGPSHVLPTAGAGRFFNGLTVSQFFRRTSLLKYNREALAREVDAVAAFARAEGLDAHGRSGTIRFE